MRTRTSLTGCLLNPITSSPLNIHKKQGINRKGNLREALLSGILLLEIMI